MTDVPRWRRVREADVPAEGAGPRCRRRWPQHRDVAVRGPSWCVGKSLPTRAVLVAGGV